METAVRLVELLLPVSPSSAEACLETLREHLQSPARSAQQRRELAERLVPVLQPVLKGSPVASLVRKAALVASCWGDARAVEVARQLLSDEKAPLPLRLEALQSLAVGADQDLHLLAARILTDAGSPDALKSGLVSVLAGRDDPWIGPLLVEQLPRQPAPVRDAMMDALTQRAPWSRTLLQGVQGQQVPAAWLNMNHVRRLAASPDPTVRTMVREIWGEVRTGRNPEREALVQRMTRWLGEGPGDPRRGAAVFYQLCGQCHQLYGRGEDVGPDITANGRASFQQLVSNVLDPNLVIGRDYQAHLVITQDGRVLTGLLVRQTPDSLVLRMQGGKEVTVPRREIDQHQLSPVSLMPEGLEQQLDPQALRDLFAFLTLDRPPEDPMARPIPGTPPGLHARSGQDGQ